MSRKRLRSLLGQLGLTQIRHVAPVRAGAAPELVAQVYQGVAGDFGVLAPPVALHAPAPQVLVASWLMWRETLIVTRQVDRAVKEAVATAVSVSNACPFCVTVHGKALSSLTGAAIEARAGGSAADPRVPEVQAWAMDCATQEGALRHEPACPVGEAPDLIGTAVLLHYFNRMATVFLGEVPLPPGVPKIALGLVMPTLGRMIQRAAREPHPPGASLDMLAPAPLPGDLSWASGNAVVADAFARASAAIDAAGIRSVPVPVRDAVMAEVAAWHGEARGPSRAWVEGTVSGLPEPHRAAGRLALLTALASYQVDKPVIEAFRRDRPDDATLIELTSWASFMAARRVGTWIPVGAAIPGPALRS